MTASSKQPRQARADSEAKGTGPADTQPRLTRQERALPLQRVSTTRFLHRRHTHKGPLHRYGTVIGGHRTLGVHSRLDAVVDVQSIGHSTSLTAGRGGRHGREEVRWGRRGQEGGPREADATTRVPPSPLPRTPPATPSPTPKPYSQQCKSGEIYLRMYVMGAYITDSRCMEGGTASSYVVAKVGSTQFSTPTKPNTRAPTWNQWLDFGCRTGQDSISVTLMDQLHSRACAKWVIDDWATSNGGRSLEQLEPPFDDVEPADGGSGCRGGGVGEEDVSLRRGQAEDGSYSFSITKTSANQLVNINLRVVAYPSRASTNTNTDGGGTQTDSDSSTHTMASLAHMDAHTQLVVGVVCAVVALVVCVCASVCCVCMRRRRTQALFRQADRQPHAHHTHAHSQEATNTRNAYGGSGNERVQPTAPPMPETRTHAHAHRDTSVLPSAPFRVPQTPMAVPATPSSAGSYISAPLASHMVAQPYEVKVMEVVEATPRSAGMYVEAKRVL